MVLKMNMKIKYMSIHTVVVQLLSVVRLSAMPRIVAPYILVLYKSRDVASEVNRRGEVVSSDLWSSMFLLGFHPLKCPNFHVLCTLQ